jgi:radical SAM superfamily enzyme YgiQ (UPF0313 family)
MKLNILLINPWIYDFAAFNLWSRPLGLLKVAEYLSSFDTELFFIDCTESGEIKKYGTGKYRSEAVEKGVLLRDIPRAYKRYGIRIEEFAERIKGVMPVDLVFMTSGMSYWYPGVQKATEIVRDILGDVPVILGGIYATLYPEHASRSSGADFIYYGSLNESINLAVNTFGFRLKRKRERIPYYKLNLYKTYPFAPVLTSRGCPFRCSYCASKLLTDTYRRRPPDEVVKEVGDLLGKGVRDFAFYDDALFADSEHHIKPILRAIGLHCPDARFHTPNGLHARFVDQELAWLMKNSHFRSIRLGLETVDSSRQKTTGDKVSNQEIERAVAYLKKEGFSKKEIGVYLMYGLPGQQWEEIKEGVRFLKTLGVSIYLTEFSPIRGTQSWSDLVREGVIHDTLDPLLTNNTVFSYLYSGYNPGDIKTMKLEVKKHNT